MIINTANLAALNVTFSASFQEAFKGTEPWYKKIASEVTVTTLKGLYGFSGLSRGVREWVGERMSIAARRHSYELGHKPFELTFAIQRQDIIRDNLGFVTSIEIPTMAENVAKHPDQSLISLVFDANPTGFDGVPFFSGAHPTYNTSGGPTTYDNTFTADASTVEELIRSLGQIKAAMSTIIGQDGRILAANHKTIICTARHEMLLRQVLNASAIPADSGSMIDFNPLRGMFDLIVIPELDAVDPDVIYMVDLTRAIKPFFIQWGSHPIFRSFTDTSDAGLFHAFQTNEFVYGIDGDNGGPYEMNCGVSLPFLAAKITLTGFAT